MEQSRRDFGKKLTLGALGGLVAAPLASSIGDSSQSLQRTTTVSRDVFDTIILGGTAVLASGPEQADIAVTGGQIAAIAAPGSLTGTGARRVIGAQGQYVIPGGIDPHVHCSWSRPPVPGETEHAISGPPAQVSKAALHGGTTTLIDFAEWRAGTSIPEAIKRRRAEWDGACYCDYALHLMLLGEVPAQTLGELAEAIQDGHASVKIFTTNVLPGRPGRMIDFGDFWEILKVVAQNGGITMVHAEDDEIVMHMYKKLIREGRVGFENIAEIHNTLSEDLAFNRVIRLAANVEGAALYMAHTSAAAGVRAIAEARARNVPVYGETLHQYLLYTAEDYKRPGGQMYHTYPSLKSREDHETLWAATRLGGAIQTVGTDEVCTPLKWKLQGSRIDDLIGGNSGVEPRLSLIFTETVEKRGYSLAEFVGLVSTNAAKILGLYPRKGVLAVGSDADLVLLDPGKRRVLKAESLHETDYTPWEGREVAAWPSMTMVRGKVMVENDNFKGEPTDGQFVHRKIAEAVRARPVV
jgi:dihydropyrimidinase